MYVLYPNLFLQLTLFNALNEKAKTILFKTTIATQGVESRLDIWCLACV